MTRFSANAVVLSRDSLGGADLGAWLFSPAQGRFYAIAKSALKSKKRFVGVFEPGQLVEVGLAAGGRAERVIVEHAAVIEAFPRFREDPARLARASVLLEVASLTVPERQPAPEAWRLLVKGLRRLHRAPDHDRWMVVYAFLLLADCGLTPELTRCVRCQGAKVAGFSPREGGLLCPDCKGDEPTMPISEDVRKSLLAVMAAGEASLSRFGFTKKAMSQARLLLRSFAAHHLGRPLNSIEVLAGLADRPRPRRHADGGRAR